MYFVLFILNFKQYSDLHLRMTHYDRVVKLLPSKMYIGNKFELFDKCDISFV